MSSATQYNPSREDFASMLDESFNNAEALEGSVVKGRVIAIEKDMAVVDLGLKTEGRVALKEFAGLGREGLPVVGDEVEVYLDRIENALGEAVISRDKARREESWVKLEVAFEAQEKVNGVIFNQVKGGYTVDLDGAVAFLPRSQVDIRPIRDVGPLMNIAQPFQILKMDRRRGNIVVSRRTVLEETRAEARTELVSNLEEGQTVDGTVKNITAYGAFGARLERMRAIHNVLAASGWDRAERSYMQGDASARAYERLTKADGSRAILMISPPRPDGPPIRDGKPYSRIAHLVILPVQGNEPPYQCSNDVEKSQPE